MNWRDLFLRARALMLTKQVEAEMDEEIHAHLERQARKYREAGLSPNEASQRARRDFGSLESMKDKCRDERRVTCFSDVTRDVQYALRMFRRDPGFSALATAVLALGIGMAVATFSVMDAILLKALPVQDPISLLRTVRSNRSPNDASGGASFPVFQRMRERDRQFADLMAYQAADQQSVVVNGTAERRLTRQIISGNYFQVLGTKSIAGRLITAADDEQAGQRPVAVISDRLWKKYFDRGAAAMGAKIRIGDQSFDIIGVAPRQFFGVEIGKVVDIWTPIAMAPAEYLQNEHLFWLQPMGQRHPGVTVRQAAAPLQAVMNEVMLDDVRQHAPPGTPKAVIDRFLADMRIKGVPAGGGIGYLRQQYQQPLELLMGLVIIVLLIACTNVGNVLLAKGSARRQEIAIRLSLGAGRMRLLQQLLTEGLFLGLVATVMGVVIAHWMAPVFVRLLTPSTKQAELLLGFDWRLVAVCSVIALISVLVCGVIPALHLSRTDVFGALRSGADLTGRTNLTRRRILVAGQIALSLVLVIGATLFSRTLGNLLSSPLGFKPTDVLVARLTLRHPGDEKERYPVAWGKLLQRVKNYPGVDSASLTSSALFDRSPQFIGVRTNSSHTPPTDPTAAIFFVSADYFKTLGLALTDGRSFGIADSQPDARHAVMVNQAFARKFFGGENPIGRQLTKMANTPEWTEVAGIVTDAKSADLRATALPILYVPFEQMSGWIAPQGHPGFEMALQIRGHQDIRSLNAAFRRDLGSQFTVVNVTQQIQLIDDTLVRERLLARIATLFGTVSLILAAVGLYGVMNYAVIQRRREFGIRIALGAAPRQIFSSLLRESSVVIVAGLLMGFVLSSLGAGAARALLYGLTPSDPFAMFTAAIVLLAATFMAALIPAFKAAATDPMKTLRNE